MNLSYDEALTIIACLALLALGCWGVILGWLHGRGVLP
jgi:hypothetical protein